MVDKKTVTIAVLCVVTVLCLGLWINTEQEDRKPIDKIISPKEPEIKIEQLSAHASIYKIDEISYSFEIKVKNIGYGSLGTEHNKLYINYKIVIKNKTFEGYDYVYLPPNSSSVFFLDGAVLRNPGEYEYNVTVNIMKEAEILATEKFAVSLPTTWMGYIIPEVASGYDKHNLSLTLISWRESTIAVNGPYIGDKYYTFTAKNNMKFIILFYQFQNKWIRVQTTPYINSGEIYTDKGYIFNVWSPPSGVWSEEYNPRKATENEVTEFIGDSGGYEKLLPEDSIKGCVVFEIPKDIQPIDLILHYVPNIIILSTNP